MYVHMKKQIILLILFSADHDIDALFKNIVLLSFSQ